MKNRIFGILFFAAITAQSFAQLPYLNIEGNDTTIDVAKYKNYINNHPYHTRAPLLKEDIKKMDKEDRPDLAYEHDWLMTHDPIDGKTHWERLIPVLKQMNNSSGKVQTVAPGGSTSNKWTERGPNDVGGRVRSIMFDPNDITNKKVFAGGVGGGLWYNNDITSSTSSWNSVNDFWANLAVSSMDYDPTNKNTFYVGTGEGFGNGGSLRGAGVWKSTNKGATWTQLTATNNSSFRYILDLKVTPTGRLVIACNNGLYTSDNGGTSFSRRITTTYIADIEIASNGDLYASTRANGVVYKSVNNGTTWTTITPSGTTGRRVELACAPSDSNTIYAIAGSTTSSNTDVSWFKKSVNGGVTWTNVTIPLYTSNTAYHFTRKQAWYDLILWVHPTNKDIVLAGGIDLFRTTNGGTSWSGISYWNSASSLPYVHADQHAIVSRPGNNNEVVFGNDGGVFYSSNAGNSSTSSPTFGHRVKNFNVTQFYAGALHPSAGSNVVALGAQDNGSMKLTTAGVGGNTYLTGGDGAFCFIDQSNSSVFITSYVYNNWRRSLNSGGTFNYLPSDNTGRFINPADYDDNLNILYSAKTSTTIKRITNMTGSYSISDVTVSSLGGTPTHIRVSPYTTSSSTLFIGANYDVYKVTNANSTPTVTKITPTTFPTEYISCVEIGASENELLVTFSSYGGKEVYYTSNGGTTWVDKSGNLPDMPIRWALFNPKNRKEVIVATELGVWSTSDITVASPNWAASNNGLANTRVDMLQYRTSDSTILAATHGRGAFTGRFKAPVSNAPIASFTSNKDTVCVGETVTYTSTSTNSPTSLSWTFFGGTPSLASGSPVTTSYNTSGLKSATLIAANSNGSNSKTQSLVYVMSKPTASLSSIGSKCVSEPAFTLNQGSPSGGVYSGIGVSSGMFNPTIAGVGTHTIKYKITNSAGCSDSATTTISVTNKPTATASSISPVCANSATITLNNGSPSGGTYTGTGVSSGIFSPAAAGPGVHNLMYIYGSSNCSDTAHFSITVNAAPNVTLAAIGPFCTSNSTQTLTQGSPSGGVYSGTGVTGSSFSPSTAGTGNHLIKYVVTNSSGCKDSATTTVSVTNGSSVSAGTVPSQCSNSPSLTLSNGSPSGGTYSGTGVSGGVFNPSVAGAGTHQIKYLLGSGLCKDSALFNIVVKAAPSVSLTAVGPFCVSDSDKVLTQGFPNGGTYSGTGVIGNKFSPTSAGIGTHSLKYKVTNGGCSDSASVSVQVGNGVTPTLGSFSNICESASPITLTGGLPTGGTYSGIGVSGGMFNPSVAGAGTHTISYTHSTACAGIKATSTITVDSIPTLTISKDTSVCLGSSIQLNVSGALSYVWTPGSSLDNATSATPNATPSVFTKYEVIGTDSKGCTNKETVNVAVNALPLISAGKDDTSCSGIPYQLNASGGSSYVWSPTTGLSGSNIANPMATITSTQLYFVLGTDTNGCSNSDSVLIVVEAKPVVKLDTFPAVCVKSGLLTLTGGIPSGGVYSGLGVSAGMFNPATAGIGTHTITYTVSNGKCSGSASETIKVVSNATILWQNKFSYCDNELAFTPNALPAGGVFSGSSIVNGKVDPTQLGAGRYDITYTYNDPSGCSATETREMVINLTTPVDTIRGLFRSVINKTMTYSVNAVNGSSYKWTITGGNVLSTQSNSITIKWGKGPKGFLYLIQTNQFGCQDSTNAEVLIAPLSTDDLTFGGGELKLFPNPAKDILYVDIKNLSGINKLKYSLVSMDGKTLKTGTFELSKGNSKHEIDLSEINTGIYFFQTEDGDHLIITPVVVSK